MDFILSELDEFGLEVFRIYKQALLHIGVNFDREDVQNAIVYCSFNMEDAFRRTIEYWRTGKMQYPSAFLISALNEGWKPYRWDDQWLEDPDLKNACLKWWDEAEVGLRGYRNVMIADVTEDSHGEYILFTNGRTMSLATAKSIGWERLLDYASQQGIIPPLHETCPKLVNPQG